MKRIAIGLLGLALAAAVQAQDAPKKALFLSKSVSFEHPCIKQVDGKPSHVDNVLNALASKMGVTITSTKNASEINAESLKNYQLLILFTQGDISQLGTCDTGQPIGPKGVDDLFAWLDNGGALIGFHCSSDTFHPQEGGDATRFLQMLGGEFAGHGKQFTGTLKAVDPGHSCLTGFPGELSVHEEWYTFKNMNKDKIHVLAMFDPGAEREKQEMYNVPDYPMVWISDHGKGRIYYNGMGHREDVWDNASFQQMVVQSALWAMGQGEAGVAPNYAAVTGESAQPPAAAATPAGDDDDDKKEKRRKAKKDEAGAAAPAAAQTPAPVAAPAEKEDKK